MVFHWSLRDNKSPQISWTFLSILADLNNVVVWTVSTPPLISKSSSFCTTRFTATLTDIFHLSMSDRKSSQLCRTFLSYQTDFDRAIVWIVSTLPLFSSSFRLLSMSSGTVLSAPKIISITVTFMLHSFFSSLAKYKYLSSFFWPSFTFCGPLAQQNPRDDKFSLIILLLVSFSHQRLLIAPSLGVCLTANLLRCRDSFEYSNV